MESYVHKLGRAGAVENRTYRARPREAYNLKTER